MVPIPAGVVASLWTRFQHTGEVCPEKWIHEVAEAAGVELPGHGVADRTPTLVQRNGEVHAIALSEGRPLNVLIGEVVRDAFVARSA